MYAINFPLYHCAMLSTYFQLFFFLFLNFYSPCRVTNYGPNPKGIGYRPNKPNTINL